MGNYLTLYAEINEFKNSYHYMVGCEEIFISFLITEYIIISIILIKKQITQYLFTQINQSYLPTIFFMDLKNPYASDSKACLPLSHYPGLYLTSLGREKNGEKVILLL